MKVAVIVANIGPTAGGMYYSVRALSQGMAVKPDVTLEVFAMGSYPEEVFKVWAPIVPKTFARLRPKSYGFAPNMLQAVVDFQPDVIHLHGMWMYSSWLALRAAAKLNCCLVLSPRGMMDPWALRNSAWKKKLMYLLQEKRLLRAVSCFHALNESEANSIRLMGYHQPICIIPNGTDLPSATLLNSVTKTAAGEKKQIVFIGRIHPKKGIPHLINAWAWLLAEKPELAAEWKLVIAGWDDGGHLEAYQKLAQSLGCHSSIEWPGSVYGEAKARLLVAATAFILPSFSEGLPMAVVEAWSYRLPVLMTPECNLPEGFSAGAAIRMEATEAGTYAGLKQLFALEPDERAKMGTNAYQLVSARFTWAQQVDRLERVYQWLFGKSDQPECIKSERG